MMWLQTTSEQVSLMGCGRLYWQCQGKSDRLYSTRIDPAFRPLCSQLFSVFSTFDRSEKTIARGLKYGRVSVSSTSALVHHLTVTTDSGFTDVWRKSSSRFQRGFPAT